MEGFRASCAHACKEFASAAVTSGRWLASLPVCNLFGFAQEQHIC